MRLINTILALAIILFFAALIYVGYKSINYYNTHAGTKANLETVLSESTGEVMAEAKELGTKIEKGMEKTATAVLGEGETSATEKEENSTLEEEDGADEALDENLTKEEETSAAAEVEEKEEAPESSEEKLSEKKPESYDSASTSKKTKKKATSTTKKKTANQAYMVVAGTFSTNKNAEVERAKLKKLGYKPEIVNFRGSKLFAVIAARAANAKEAGVIVNRLKAKGIESYARKRR